MPRPRRAPSSGSTKTPRQAAPEPASQAGPVDSVDSADSVSPEIRKSGRVAIVGRPNVGKSTLLNALLGEPLAITSRHPQTTRDRVAGVVVHGDTQVVFVDTPGLHRARTRLGARMNQEAREGTRDADVVVFVTDVPPGVGGDISATRAGVRAEDAKILAGIPEGKPVILVVNKVDKVTPKSALFPVLEEHAKARDFAAVVPTSASREDNVRAVLDEVVKLLPEGPALFEDEAMTDKPVRFFVAEYVREQILRNTREEVPHGVAVVVERFEEGRVPKIELVVHVDKDSHKKIVIGAGGALIKEIGTRARAKVERLMGTQVALKIWVRVTPGWYEKDALLRDLGYEPPSETDEST
jgi:GTP-binding protein Era